MSFKSFVDGVGDFITGGLKALDNSGIPSKIGHAIGTTTAVGAGVAGKVANKGASTTIGAVARTKEFLIDHGDDIKEGAIKIGKSTLLEANQWGQAAAGAVEAVDRTLLKKAPLGESLIGRKVNGAGLAVFGAGAVLTGTISSGKEYINNRQGSNDGRLYGVTPQITNPYSISQEMAYSQHGQSFANNAGADGDLVRAISNMR